MRILYTDSVHVLEAGHPLWGAEIEHSQQQLVREALMSLPDGYRAAVEMRVYAQWTFQKMADAMGWPGRNYAHSYYKRGLELIRRYVNEQTDRYGRDDAGHQ